MDASRKLLTDRSCRSDLGDAKQETDICLKLTQHYEDGVEGCVDQRRLPQDWRKLEPCGMEGTDARLYGELDVTDGIAGVPNELCAGKGRRKDLVDCVKKTVPESYEKPTNGGMTNVIHQHSPNRDGSKDPTYGEKKADVRERLKGHAEKGNGGVAHKLRTYHDRTKAAGGGVEGAMEDVAHELCVRQDRERAPAYGLEGVRARLYRKNNAEDGMAGVEHELCNHEDYSDSTHGVMGSEIRRGTEHFIRHDMSNESCGVRTHERPIKDSIKGLKAIEVGPYPTQHAEGGGAPAALGPPTHSARRNAPTLAVKETKGGLSQERRDKDENAGVIRGGRPLHDTSKRATYPVEGPKIRHHCERHEGSEAGDTAREVSAGRACGVYGFGTEATKLASSSGRFADGAKGGVAWEMRNRHSGGNGATYGEEVLKSRLNGNWKREGSRAAVTRDARALQGHRNYERYKVNSAEASQCGELHAKGGIMDIIHQLCARQDCGQLATYGVVGTKVRLYCEQHAEDNMMDLVHMVGTGQGYTQFDFGDDGTGPYAWCKQRAECGVEGVGHEPFTIKGWRNDPVKGMEEPEAGLCSK